MRWRFRLWIIPCSLLLLPTPGLAAAAPSDDATAIDHLIADWDRERNLCFHPPDDPLPGYAYGAGYVELNPLSVQDATVNVGGTVAVTGVVKNSNPHYAFTNAKLIYDIERENPSVKAENWNDQILRDTVNLGNIPPGGSQPFTVPWRIPASAPGGSYAFAFYVASAESAAQGALSFVVNTGTTAHFSVEDGGDASRAFFKRDSVTMNASPRSLRFPPPTLPADTPVNAGVTLAAEGTRRIAGTVTTKVYAWSGDENNTPVYQTTEERVLVPGEPQIVALTNWTPPSPNAYEVRFLFAPDDPQVPPSLLWDRFMIAGVAPHVLFSGLVTNSSGESYVLTCAMNATEGLEESETTTEDGTITTTVAASPATILEVPWWRHILASLVRAATPGSLQATGVVRDGEVTTTVIPVSRSALRNGINIQTVATDAKGKTTDSRTVAVPARRASGRQPAPTGVLTPLSDVRSRFALLVLVLASGGLGIRLLMRQRKRP